MGEWPGGDETFPNEAESALIAGGKPKNYGLGDEASKHKSAKDTKTWCKGIVGRDHSVSWVDKNWGWSLLTCSVCGKVLDFSGVSDDLSAAIKRIRNQKRLSQAALGALLDPPMSQEQISYIEHCKRWTNQTVSLNIYRRVLDAMGYSVMIKVIEDK